MESASASDKYQLIHLIFNSEKKIIINNNRDNSE